MRNNLHINKDHAAQKMVITSGVLISSTLSLAAPHLTTHAVVIAIVTNLVWLWF